MSQQGFDNFQQSGKDTNELAKQLSDSAVNQPDTNDFKNLLNQARQDELNDIARYYQDVGYVEGGSIALAPYACAGLIVGCLIGLC